MSALPSPLPHDRTFIRHSKGRPCPLCGGANPCRTFIDGATECLRVESAIPSGSGLGWIHFPDDRPGWRDRLPVPPPAKLTAAEPDPADITFRDRAFRFLLDHLPLTDDDRDHLRGRGLTAAEIEYDQYRSLPGSGPVRETVARALVAALPECRGQVPGLYWADDETPTLAGHAGLLIPGFGPPDADGYRPIIGIQIRPVDSAVREEGKYRLFSSTGFAGGCNSGTPASVAVPICGVAGGAVMAGEGWLKGNIIAHRTGRAVVSMVGVSTRAGVLPAIRALEAAAVITTLDNDRATNPHVARAETQLIADLTAAALDVKRATWPDLYKGLDDALVAGVLPLIEPVTPPCAEIVAEKDQEIADLRADNAKLKRTVSVVIATVTNPSLKAEAATLVRTAVEIDRQRREGLGQVGPDGFRRLSTARIGDDWSRPVDEDGPPPVTPIRGRSTVNRHLQNLAEFGLLDHRIEEVPKEMVLPDKRTGLPRKRTVPVKETWVHMPGEGLADMLQAAALFRREQPSNHGGKRPRKEAPAECPSCGSENMLTLCGDCGTVVEEPPPASSFQDEFALDVKRATPSPPAPARRSSQIQDETTKPRPPRVPDDAAWIDTVTVDEDPGASLGETWPASPILPPRLPLTGARIPLAAADHAADRDEQHRAHTDLAAYLEPIARVHGHVPVPKPGPELRPVAIDDGYEDGAL